MTATALIKSSTVVISASEISVRQLARSARNASCRSPQSSVKLFDSGQARSKWRKGRAARRSHQMSNSSKHPALMSSGNIDRFSSGIVEEGINDAPFRMTVIAYIEHRLRVDFSRSRSGHWRSRHPVQSDRIPANQNAFRQRRNCVTQTSALLRRVTILRVGSKPQVVEVVRKLRRADVVDQPTLPLCF
jgi:hypothetical protein